MQRGGIVPLQIERAPSRDLAAVEWNAESEGVEVNESVAGSLVQVAFIGVIEGGGEIMSGGGVEVCEGDYVILLSEAVEDSEEGVFAAGYEGYDLMGRRGWHRQ